MGSHISEEPIDEEEGEGSGDEGIGSAASEYRRNKSVFAAKVHKLFRVIGIIKYPVEVLAALTDEGTRGNLDGVSGKRKEICSLEAVCHKCGKMLSLLRRETITAVVPVSGVGGGTCCGAMIQSLWSHAAPWVDVIIVYCEEPLGRSGRTRQKGDRHCVFLRALIDKLCMTRPNAMFSMGGDIVGRMKHLLIAFEILKNNMGSCFHEFESFMSPGRSVVFCFLTCPGSRLAGSCNPDQGL